MMWMCFGSYTFAAYDTGMWQGSINFSTYATSTGADLGFYKGGCPIHLKGAPEVERWSRTFSQHFIFSNMKLRQEISSSSINIAIVNIAEMI